MNIDQQTKIALSNKSAFPSAAVSKFDINDDSLDGLLEKNKEWAARVLAEDPNFFSTIAEKQQPKILWIGCSDSRVPAVKYNIQI